MVTDRHHRRSREQVIMAAWIKRYAGVIALVFTVGTAYAGVYVKAALADANTKIAILEDRQRRVEQDISEIKTGVNKLVDRFVDRGWKDAGSGK